LIGNSILSAYGVTVFDRMSALAAEHGAINLGQGFPDEDGPSEILEKAAEALLQGPNQYPPLMGIAELRRAIADHDRRFYGIEADWNAEVMVTSGAGEAIAACLLGLINPGDEVVMIEPLYDSYLPMVRRAGGIPKLVRMEPPRWELPRAALAEAFSDRTRLIILNSPHNPAGKVFNGDELDFIAGLLQTHNAYAVCDEVYEHLTFDGVLHLPLMTKEGMRERCLRIGSAGKTFSVTGWKVGYVVACPALLAPVAKAHQFITFTVPPHLQKAAAFGLRLDDAYFTRLASGLRIRHDLLAQGLTAAGFKVLPSAGTYFLTADFSRLGFAGSDEDFCRHITVKAGVTAVPMSAFYDGDKVNNFVRFCFYKREEVLTEASARLGRCFA